jgi:hypothetical protein
VSGILPGGATPPSVLRGWVGSCVIVSDPDPDGYRPGAKLTGLMNKGD